MRFNHIPFYFLLFPFLLNLNFAYKGLKNYAYHMRVG